MFVYMAIPLLVKLYVGLQVGVPAIFLSARLDPIDYSTIANCLFIEFGKLLLFPLGSVRGLELASRR